jgi:hypothetical protein
MGGASFKKSSFFSSRAVYRRKESSGRLFNSGGGRSRLEYFDREGVFLPARALKRLEARPLRLLWTN